MKIVVLASGNGSTFQAIVDRCEHVDILALITNNPDSHALVRAKEAHIHYAVTTHEDIRRTVQYFNPELVVLAGYMRILTPAFLESFPSVINIHPSLLPAYRGLNTYERVLADNEDVHGTTVHWVNEDLDAGQIIAQEVVPIDSGETAKTLQVKTQEVERELYPRILDEIARSWSIIQSKVVF